MRGVEMEKSSNRAFQKELAYFNSCRLQPSLPSSDWNSRWNETEKLRLGEEVFLEEQRSGISDRAREAPTEPLSYMQWFEELALSGPGQGDPLFEWLEHEC